MSEKPKIKCDTCLHVKVCSKKGGLIGRGEKGYTDYAHGIADACEEYLSGKGMGK